MNPLEKKHVLSLFPYFSKEPIVFDVGSNKGNWADFTVNNVSEMFLIEPNPDLLTYTRVKYDDLDNVLFYHYAVTETTGQKVTLTTFDGVHHQRGNIFGNNQEDDFVRTIQVETVSIDEFCGKGTYIDHIDFLKIDAEGADYLVLIGAERMLTAKKIKFVQVEYTHILENRLLSFMSDMGYKKILDDGENAIFAQVDFTQDWNQEFRKNTEGLKFNFALEIGCFEGMTTRYICDNLLNPGGRVICIDPLEDKYTESEPMTDIFKGQYDRLIRNTRGYPVELIRKKSNELLNDPAFDHYRFDFIYIDGDHSKEAVYLDGLMAFSVCQVGGIILFDDYKGYRDETTQGINDFLNFVKGKYEVMVSGYQLMIKKLQD